MEEIGQAPEQVFEVGFELGVAKRAGKDAEEVQDGGGQEVRIGQGTGIGLARSRAVAV